MNAIILEAPGRLRLHELEPPGSPGAGDVLVRVHRVGICGTDIHAYGGRQPFFSYPRRIGHELGVEVLEVGEEVTNVRAGDRCAVEPYLNCGLCIACRRGRGNCCVQLQVLGVHVDGGLAEQILVPARKLHVSKGLTYEQLALVETLAIGAHAVGRGQVEQGEWTLVIGAGPIGLGVMQFARRAGGRVIALDTNAARLDFCRKAWKVEHTVSGGEGALDAVRALTGGDLPTAVFDATGNPGSMRAAFDFVAPGGRLVFVGLFPGEVAFFDPDFHRKEMTLLATRNALPREFADIIGWIESWAIETGAWVTHRTPIAELPAAFEGWTKGESGVIKGVVEV